MTTPTAIDSRPGWMGLLARSAPARLAKQCADLPPHDMLRPPETGSVLARGRLGGTGQPFNLGEMTVTRCVLRLNTGEVGHAHVQGRDKAHATRAAVIDALMAGPDAERVRQEVLQPLHAEETAMRSARAARAAGTKVEFFTLVRGEDQ